MISDKDKKTIYNLLVKVSNIFSEFYIFKNGYFISSDIEKPFVIQLDTSYIELFKELCGDFKILRITDVKNFKKSLTSPKLKKDELNSLKEEYQMYVLESGDSVEPFDEYIKKYQDEWPVTENYFYSVISNSESETITKLLSERITETNKCSNWERFELSENPDENTKLLLSLFKENNYINFLPKDNMDGPDIILTKSLLPLVSEKNYTDLYYSSRKENSNLFLIVFDFQFSMFRLFMFHYYIPIKE